MKSLKVRIAVAVVGLAVAVGMVASSGSIRMVEANSEGAGLQDSSDYRVDH